MSQFYRNKDARYMTDVQASSLETRGICNSRVFHMDLVENVVYNRRL